MSARPNIEYARTLRAAAAAGAVLIALSIGVVDRADATDASDVKREAAETLDTIKDYSADRRDEAVAAGKALVDTLDARIEELEEKAGSASDRTSDATRAKWAETKQDLMALRAKAASQLEAMRDSGASVWSKARDGFADAIVNLGQSIKDAGKDAGSDDGTDE